MNDLESESAGHAKARHARRLRRIAAESGFAFAFVALAHVGAHAAKTDGPHAPAAVGAIALAACVFVGWSIMYVRWHRALDEFERILELRAVAIAGGAIIVAATVWGLAETTLGAPRPPLVLIAPLFSALCWSVRLLMRSAYR